MQKELIFDTIQTIFSYKFLKHYFSNKQYKTKTIVDIYPEQYNKIFNRCDKIIFTIRNKKQLEKIKSIHVINKEKSIRIYIDFNLTEQYRDLLKIIEKDFSDFSVIPFSYPHRPKYANIKSLEQCVELWKIANTYIYNKKRLELYATGDQDLWWACSLIKRLDPKPTYAYYENYHDSSAVIVPCTKKWKKGCPPCYPEQKHFAFCYPKWVPILGEKRQNVWGNFIQKAKFFQAICQKEKITPAVLFDYSLGNQHPWQVNKKCLIDYTKRTVEMSNDKLEYLGWIYYWAPHDKGYLTFTDNMI